MTGTKRTGRGPRTAGRRRWAFLIHAIVQAAAVQGRITFGDWTPAGSLAWFRRRRGYDR